MANIVEHIKNKLYDILSQKKNYPPPPPPPPHHQGHQIYNLQLQLMKHQ